MKIPNQTIFTADNLDILRGMDSESVNLIYLDPPFNSNRHYEAPIGSEAAGAEFKDAWTFEDTKHAWWGLIADEHPGLYKVIDAAGDIGNKGDKAYLIYMATRLLEMHRILKPTGSIYLHCDPTMSHSLKMVMDAIFGRKNYRNEITWRRIMAGKGSQHLPSSWGRNTDIIFFFTKTDDFKLRPYRRLTANEIQEKFNKVDDKGDAYLDDTSHIFRPQALGNRPNLCFEWRGFKNPNPSGWVMSKDRLEEEYKKGNFVIRKDGKLERRKYLKDYPGFACGNLWDDLKPPSPSERTGYPTQKPLALLRRIIEASSNKGDMVLDPFCGCATACLAAESLQRQWIGVDISPLAADLIRIRAEKELTDLLGSQKGIFKINHRTDIPIRSEHLKPPSKDINHTLFGQQEGKCNGCGHSFPFQNFTRDHIVPKAKGGSDTDENLQLLCGRCNSIKGDRIMEYLIAKLIDEGIIEKPVKRR